MALKKKIKKYMFIRRERNREKEINFVLHIYFLINFLDGGARRFLWNLQSVAEKKAEGKNE